MGATNDNAIEVEDVPPVILREESEEGGLDSIASASADDITSDTDGLFVEDNTSRPRRSKRTRLPIDEDAASSSPEVESEPVSKRRKGNMADGAEVTDDKKKMAMDTSYDGFSIYGRVLCLVVKRKDRKAKGVNTPGGQAMMEDWITSTQMPAQEEDWKACGKEVIQHRPTTSQGKLPRPATTNDAPALVWIIGETPCWKYPEDLDFMVDSTTTKSITSSASRWIRSEWEFFSRHIIVDKQVS